MSTTNKSKKQSTRKRSQTRRKNKEIKQQKSFIKKEILILVSLALSIYLEISHFGIGGAVGDFASQCLRGLFGLIGYVLPIIVFICVVFAYTNAGNKVAYIKLSAGISLIITTSMLLQLIVCSEFIGQNVKILYQECQSGGGVIGGGIVNLLNPMIDIVGTYIFTIVCIIIALVVLTGKSFVGTVKKESERVYQTAKEDFIRRKEENEAKEKDKQPELKRMDKVVSGVSFNTTLEKELPNEEEVKVQEEVEETFTPSKAEGIVINRSAPIAEEEDFEEPVREVVEKKPRSTKESRENADKEASQMEDEIKKQEIKPKKAYKFPPLYLLTKGRATGGDSDAHLRETAKKLEQTLQNFNVNVTVTNVSCGPAVTRYELQPEQGVKVSKIVGLADDIKLNLAASDIRIEAPIPGKAAVGIEVPNKENAAVMLRDLLESPEFKTHPSKIAFATGRDIGGKVVIADIAKMPHVLIAGATGSGKSVCINTLIMSILYKATPEEVKMIMIDPKVVELKVYNGIPHLLIPVVTDPKKAAGALNWAVQEMTRRYQLFAEYNVRDLKGYNQKVESVQNIESENKPTKLPQIVIIVDELADLMMVAPGEVEDAICRLAQLARACGIHLVLATQRPSVNVITGLIKANMPSRIAFAVSSGVDSRTIIDMNGAEKLLGKGDMLFYPAGYPKPARVQGTFVSDQEVQAVVDYLASNGNGAQYSEDVANHINTVHTTSGAGFSDGGSDERDEYFIYAGQFVIESDKASIGMLQRKFKIGFNRAARIMDQLADAGVVGPEEGTKPRKILMSIEEFEQYVDEYV